MKIVWYHFFTQAVHSNISCWITLPIWQMRVPLHEPLIPPRWYIRSLSPLLINSNSTGNMSYFFPSFFCSQLVLLSSKNLTAPLPQLVSTADQVLVYHHGLHSQKYGRAVWISVHHASWQLVKQVYSRQLQISSLPPLLHWPIAFAS